MRITGLITETYRIHTRTPVITDTGTLANGSLVLAIDNLSAQGIRVDLVRISGNRAREDTWNAQELYACGRSPI